jgi:general secretion pathway protein G
MVFLIESGDMEWCGTKKGFTLIELMVVMAIIAVLIVMVMPRYLGSVDKSKETALHQDLALMRDALDKYYGDHGTYPDKLEDMVSKHYLRTIPPDPITGSTTTWIIVPPESNVSGEVYNVKSGAVGKALDGTSYSEW